MRFREFQCVAAKVDLNDGIDQAPKGATGTIIDARIIRGSPHYIVEITEPRHIVIGAEEHELEERAA